MVPEPASIERFRGDLDALATRDVRLGVALSGGPDSLALLLLACAARPGNIEAATVDHALRDGSRAEAVAAAAMCAQIGVPHTILTAEWHEKPTTAVQERARTERYRRLAEWAQARGLQGILTGHHADDQAETLLMRLNRGAGVRGLAGLRAKSDVPGSDVPLLRPLLGWRRSELLRLCADAGLQPIADPSNADERFERVRVRKALSEAAWLDAAMLAGSAAHLGDADEALEWAVDQLWRSAVSEDRGQLIYTRGDAATEIVRRVVARAILALGHEGMAEPLRARELDPLIAKLRTGGQSTLRGVLCAGGPQWRFARAAERRS